MTSNSFLKKNHDDTKKDDTKILMMIWNYDPNDDTKSLKSFLNNGIKTV